MNLRNLSCISRIFRPHRHTSEIDGSNTKALCGDLFIEPFRWIGAGLTVLCGFPECQYWTNTVCNCFKNKYTQWSATNTTVATLSNLQIHPKLQWKFLSTPNDCIVPQMLVFWGKKIPHGPMEPVWDFSLKCSSRFTYFAKFCSERPSLSSLVPGNVVWWATHPGTVANSLGRAFRS